uniref:VPS33B-interacting protein in apical-basolateral polarity regulator n=1 Tax=Romanomermis culicivorax TaxID=13658 RepID=A0A915HTA5_ROMCU
MQNDRWTETLMRSLNRKEEAVSLEYKNAFNQLESNSKLKALRFLRDKFVLDADLCWEQENISEHSALLERQMAVEKVDVKNSQIPKAALLIDQPVQTTLYYCCLYHYDSNPNDISSPLSLKNFHKLSDKQYVLTALKTLSKQKRWLDIEKLFFNKSLFGSPKFRSCIDVERIAEILAKSGATPEVLSFYIRNEISNDKKFDLAKKYQCHQIVVDCYVAARNRIALIDYMAKNLRSGTPAYFYADSSLKNSVANFV